MVIAIAATAQTTTFPEQPGQRCRYTAYIEIRKAYVSGLCILANNDGEVAGSVFNEFGISMFDFTYNPQTEKAKLVSTAAMLDKWYIRRVLRKDISLLMQALRSGGNTYRDEKHGLSFTLTPVITNNNEENETAQ